MLSISFITMFSFWSSFLLKYQLVTGHKHGAHSYKIEFLTKCISWKMNSCFFTSFFFFLLFFLKIWTHHLQAWCLFSLDLVCVIGWLFSFSLSVLRWCIYSQTIVGYFLSHHSPLLIVMECHMDRSRGWEGESCLCHNLSSSCLYATAHLRLLAPYRSNNWTGVDLLPNEKKYS